MINTQTLYGPIKSSFFAKKIVNIKIIKAVYKIIYLLNQSFLHYGKTVWLVSEINKSIRFP